MHNQGCHQGVVASAELLEVLLCEENVMDVVGALEFDPELAVRQNHRAFLREHVIFKEVMHLLHIDSTFTGFCCRDQLRADRQKPAWQNVS